MLNSSTCVQYALNMLTLSEFGLDACVGHAPYELSTSLPVASALHVRHKGTRPPVVVWAYPSILVLFYLAFKTWSAVRVEIRVAKMRLWGALG